MDFLSDADVSVMQNLIRAVTGLTSALQQSNAQMAAAMQQQQQSLTNALAHIMAQNNEAIGSAANQMAGAHHAVASAMTSKRRLVRGADGRVEGVEFTQ